MSAFQRNKAQMLQRFRDALRKAEESPSEETVAALRDVAAPLLDELRAEYVAAGYPEDDEAGMLRWVRARLLARQEFETADASSDILRDVRNEGAG
jgi:hypothetical protein